MQHDQVREFVEPRQESGPVGEIDVGFVEDDHAVEAAQQPFDLRRRKGVARGVVGRAEPQQFAPFVRRREQPFDRQREVVAERHFAQFNVVDGRRDAVHAVGRCDRDRVVDARPAEDAVGQIDRLVAAAADEDTVGGDALACGEHFPQPLLARIGIAVDAVVVGTFVGVEPHVDALAAVLVACGGVGGERADVGADEFCERSHRTPPSSRMRTASACASSPSARAMATTVGASARSPSHVSS